jgi:hypothetical protein
MSETSPAAEAIESVAGIRIAIADDGMIDDPDDFEEIEDFDEVTIDLDESDEILITPDEDLPEMDVIIANLYVI